MSSLQCLCLRIVRRRHRRQSENIRSAYKLNSRRHSILYESRSEVYLHMYIVTWKLEFFMQLRSSTWSATLYENRAFFKSLRITRIDFAKNRDWFPRFYVSRNCDDSDKIREKQRFFKRNENLVSNKIKYYFVDWRRNAKMYY